MFAAAWFISVSKRKQWKWLSWWMGSQNAQTTHTKLNSWLQQRIYTSTLNVMDPKIYASKRNQIKRTYDPFVLNVQKRQMLERRNRRVVTGHWEQRVTVVWQEEAFWCDKFNHIFLFYAYECFICMCAYVLVCDWCPWGPERALGPWNCCYRELWASCGNRELNIGFPKQKQMLLTDKLPLQPSEMTNFYQAKSQFK